MSSNPYVVPPFDPGWTRSHVRFYWWCWHPNYPYWSKYGSNGYDTQEEAWVERAKPINSSLDLYHNKLVRQEGGVYMVVADDPCRRLDVWREIKERKDSENSSKPNRASKSPASSPKERSNRKSKG